MTDDALPFLLALQSINGIGTVKLRKLIDYFQNPEAAWQARAGELTAAGFSSLDTEKIIHGRKQINPQQLFEQILRQNLKIVSLFDSDYPQNLVQIYDPPIVLFYRGNLPKNEQPSIAIVGTRKVTGYGRLVTEKFATELAAAGLTIISGLARGVDSIAHQSTLKAQGRTLAVLGGGLNQLYPPENQNLANQIIDSGGAVISEYFPDVLPNPGHFPARNRIIAGLSQAVLVTEADINSGSLITARQALEMGREIFAIPGPITSQLSLGTAELIKNGATLVTDPAEIPTALHIEPQTSNFQPPVLSSTDQQILSLLQNDTLHIDQICRQLKQPSSQTSAALMKLEIKGVVKNLGGGNYISIH